MSLTSSMADTGVQTRHVEMVAMDTVNQETPITLYCTTTKLMNKNGVPTIMDALHTMASAFRVYFPRNFDSSEPAIVPMIPVHTAIAPNPMAALQ